MPLRSRLAAILRACPFRILVLLHGLPPAAQSGTTSRVSVDSAGVQGNNFSVTPPISADGRCVAFFSGASNLVPGDTNETWDVFVRDRQDCAASVATYCTAKTSSSGCAPAIGYVGTPSASASGGFTVSATQIEASQPGVFFYGVTGPDALPFQGGWSCVNPPIQRTPPQDSGTSGSPPCTGVLALDLNASGICASIGVGYRGWMQVWFRDPASFTGTVLTDALEWTVCP